MDLKKDFFYALPSGSGNNDKLWLCSGTGSGFENEVMFAARDHTECQNDGFAVNKHCM